MNTENKMRTFVVWNYEVLKTFKIYPTILSPQNYIYFSIKWKKLSYLQLENSATLENYTTPKRSYNNTEKTVLNYLQLRN
jgi:hypothetical protein